MTQAEKILLRLNDLRIPSSFTKQNLIDALCYAVKEIDRNTNSRDTYNSNLAIDTLAFIGEVLGVKSTEKGTE